MENLKYSVEMCDGSIPCNSFKEAITIATETRHKAYIKFFRLSDGQKGYYNKDNGYALTGKAW